MYEHFENFTCLFDIVIYKTLLQWSWMNLQNQNYKTNPTMLFQKSQDYNSSSRNKILIKEALKLNDLGWIWLQIQTWIPQPKPK